jgi:hypothetical protein
MEKFLLNSLAVECPELCKDWHPTKNLPLTTTSVTFGSGKKVWWKCHECGYEWMAYIQNRRNQHKYPGQPGTSCTNCIGRVINMDNSFGAEYPELVEEWHPTKNIPHNPYNIFPTTPSKFWWVCKLCKNEWKTSAGTRARGGGCPVCNIKR